MAASSKQVLLVAVIAAVACLASPASATHWVVGDQCGWRSNFNETCWADGKTFVVGDTLQFVYLKDMHTVVQVDEDDFAACNLEGNQLGSWCSGNDVVTLDKPGKLWFICTKPNHCLNGMKLAIDVVDLTVAPSPPPSVYHLLDESAPAPAPASLAVAPPAPAPASPAPAPASPAPAPASPAAAPLAPAPASPAAAPPALASPGVALPAPAATPSSAAIHNPVGGTVAAAAAAVVVAALVF